VWQISFFLNQRASSKAMAQKVIIFISVSFGRLIYLKFFELIKIFTQKSHSLQVLSKKDS
jgi:hypothetical protein